MTTGKEGFTLTQLFITLLHRYRIRHKPFFGFFILCHRRIWRTRILKGVCIIKHNPLRMLEPYDLPAFRLKNQFVPRSKHTASILKNLTWEELTAVYLSISPT